MFCAQSLSYVRLFATPWTVAHQAPLSMEFSRQEILEWVAISFFRGSFQSRDQTLVSCIFCIGRRILCHLSCPGSSVYAWSLVFSLYIIFISFKDHSQDLSQHQGQRDKTFEIPVPGSCPVCRDCGTRGGVEWMEKLSQGALKAREPIT